MKISKVSSVDLALREKEKQGSVKPAKVVTLVLDQLEIVGGEAALFAEASPISKNPLKTLRKKKKPRV